MQPKHFLRCLGQPVLFAPNGEPIRFRTKKHLALLVYLAVEQGRAHRRDRLAEFFWPKAKTSEARHSLATGLSILRPRLATGALEANREHVKFNADYLTTDLSRLESNDLFGKDAAGILEVTAFSTGLNYLMLTSSRFGRIASRPDCFHSFAMRLLS